MKYILVLITFLLANLSSGFNSLTNMTLEIKGVLRDALNEIAVQEENLNTNRIQISFSMGKICQDYELNIGEIDCSESPFKNHCSILFRDKGRTVKRQAEKLLSMSHIKQVHFHSHYFSGEGWDTLASVFAFLDFEETESSILLIRCTSTSNEHIKLNDVNKHLGGKYLTENQDKIISN